MLWRQRKHESGKKRTQERTRLKEKLWDKRIHGKYTVTVDQDQESIMYDFTRMM